ncbi:MAG: DNA replication/repair protein RecF [Myxococcales bacterium]|nr:DNA replication/repair protein RecF [Myxococcales bacterium]
MASPVPLRLERIQLRGFRNLSTLDLRFGAHFNVVHGDNGAGKSNLLEAIYYLGSLSSFRGAKTDDLIGLDAEQAILRARLLGGGAPQILQAALGRGRARRLQLDGRRPRSISQWHAGVQMVLFHPGDVELSAASAEPRRAFLDRIVEQIEAGHRAELLAYGKALRSRNRLLKDERVERRAVQVYDALLARHGEAIGQARARIVERIAPRAQRAFAEVAGVELPLELRYQPRVEPERERLLEALAASYAKDRARGFTADGPHGDDLGISVRQVSARHHASQGQHRAIVLSLKVAELEVLTERVGRVPILLLDDVSSELDRARNRRFFELLARMGGQVFLTTTHPEFILLDRERVDLQVCAGRVDP